MIDPGVTPSSRHAASIAASGSSTCAPGGRSPDPAGAADGGVDGWAPDADRSGYEVVDFARLAQLDDSRLLGTRRSGEHAAAHVDGATHVPLHELLDRLDEVPEGPVHVHCASGYRASIAASLLDRAGHDVVLVDDDFDHAADAGLALSGG